jgi:tetratricopeptide (TPR) repeat protein
LAISGDYAEAHYTLGTVLKQQQKLDESILHLREAIRLQPDFAGAHVTLAAVLRQMGDLTGAETEARLGSEIARSKTNLQAASFATNSGKRLLLAGDLEGAISQFKTAIRNDDSYLPAHAQLAIALKKQGKRLEAESELKKVAELQSRH